MRIKTLAVDFKTVSVASLKNLPTTWGLRQNVFDLVFAICSLKNLPTTWGLRRYFES